MRKKQKGGILPLLMLMNAMKGGGIKRKKTKSGKQKGGFIALLIASHYMNKYANKQRGSGNGQKGGFFIPDRFKYKSGKRPKNLGYYKPFGIG